MQRFLLGLFVTALVGGAAAFSGSQAPRPEIDFQRLLQSGQQF